MWLYIVCDLVADAASENELPTVRERSVQFAVNTEQNMTLRTPVVAQISRAVFDPKFLVRQ